MSTQLGHAPSQHRRMQGMQRACLRHIYHLPPQLTLIPHGTLSLQLHPTQVAQGAGCTPCRYLLRATRRLPHATCHKPRPLCTAVVSSLVYSNCAYFRQQDVNIFAQVALNSTRHAPNTGTNTHMDTDTDTHTETYTDTWKEVCFACLSWFYTLLRRLIVLLLFNAISLVLANFELSSRFGLNLKAVAGETFEMR